MKKVLFLITLFGIVLTSFAQDITSIGGQNSIDIKNPLEWEGSITKESDTEYLLTITGFIDNDWHVYSQHTPVEGIGPIPLALDFRNVDKDLTLLGPLEESETHRTYSDVWGFDEVYFSEIAVLTQKIKLSSPDIKVIKAELFYQVCIDVCLNEDRYIVFDLVSLNSFPFYILF